VTQLTLVEADSEMAEHRFNVTVDGELVPGLLWSPSDTQRTGPTLLLGHGRTAHKRSPHQLALGRLMARRGWNVVSIDAPDHGERRAPDAAPIPARADPDAVIRDWRSAVDFLSNAAGIDTERVGYWGVSMGASLGISLIAGDGRIQAAVLGLMHADWPSPPGTRIRADAARLTCPVLFLVNWDDQRVPRLRAFELFDLIGSVDKRLHAYPGDHAELPKEAMTASVAFLARNLEAR
jgi:pimeloyl-ACP methyl ester carboxylesterase